MSRIIIIVFFLMVRFIYCAGQRMLSSYSASINFATAHGPMSINGRIFKFSGDTLTMLDSRGKSYFINPQKDYDTAYYLLTSPEKQNIIATIKSIDSLKDVMNPCIVDGLIFYFSYSIDTTHHSAWVSNAYDDKIYQFIDIINNHVPEKYWIRYDKNELLQDTKQCLENFYKK